MFSKAALTLLALGVLYVNALTVPIARSPAPEPEFDQDLMARVNFESVKREILDGLFSRESKKPGVLALPVCPHPPNGFHGLCRNW